MTNQLDHYISNHIKSLYRHKLFSPILYMILLIVLWIIFPIGTILSPKVINEKTSLDKLYKENDRYVSITLTDLKFTGYTQEVLGQTHGYYYYTIQDGCCNIVLLSPKTSEDGLPNINKVTVHAKIQTATKSYHTLLSKIAADLNWTDSGIYGESSSYYISEPGFRYGFSIFLILLFACSGLYAIFSIICYFVYIHFPWLSPPCQQLARFGSPKTLLMQAEEELATLPQLATEDMFITEHFFIEISTDGIAFVPIQEIIWLYKHSTLHKFFWYHFSISYTLCISAKKHLYIQCPKNLKSDIDGIIDYLAEANHDILVGFNEKNRLKVQEIQGTPLQFEKFIALLKKRL